MTNSNRSRQSRDFSSFLRRLEKSARRKAEYNLVREGFYRGVLKAGFIKALEFAGYSNRLSEEQASDTAYYLTASLRGICEDLICLKFVRQLPRKLRDEVISIKMRQALRKATVAQYDFFSTVRPFQPVFRVTENVSSAVADKSRLTSIGSNSGLWKTKDLPSIEEMAKSVGLTRVYNYFYRISSDLVHFNPRVALRMGWGSSPKSAKFSTKNFSGYYLDFSRVYSVFLLDLFCRTFRKELGLDLGFMADLNGLKALLDQVIRWPEAVTFEEMNLKGPPQLLRITLKVFHDDKETKKMTGRLAKSGSEQNRERKARNVE
jgi:hypothetical protein